MITEKVSTQTVKIWYFMKKILDWSVVDWLIAIYPIKYMKMYSCDYSYYIDSPHLCSNKSYYIILIQYSWFEIDTYNKYIHLFKQKNKDFSCPQYSSSIPSFQFIQLHGNSIFIWKSDRHNNNNKNRKKVAYQDEEFI